MGRNCVCESAYKIRQIQAYIQAPCVSMSWNSSYWSQNVFWSLYTLFNKNMLIYVFRCFKKYKLSPLPTNLGFLPLVDLTLKPGLTSNCCLYCCICFSMRFSWARGQPDFLWCDVNLPVTWPDPSHPGVSHFLKVEISLLIILIL